MRDLRTKAIVLRRTNFGETDRILNVLTPEGQRSVRARGVRKEKSRLAGGIEMFCLSDIVIHEGKSEIGTLTSAKMLRFYQNIMTDLARLELASEILKKVNRASGQVDNAEFFEVTRQSFEGLDEGVNPALVEAWFLENLGRAAGEDLNLVRDNTGAKLEAEKSYHWDGIDQALAPDERGAIKAPHIKLMRLMLVSPLKTAAKVTGAEELLPDVLHLIKTWYN